MPKTHPTEVRDRATRMALDRLKDSPSITAADRDLAPKLNIGAWTLRKWVVQSQIGAGGEGGRVQCRARGNQNLKREVKDLKEANGILRSASISFARELCPRCD